MNNHILQNLASKSSSSVIPIPFKSSTTTKHTQNLLTSSYHGRYVRISPISSTGGSTNNIDGKDAAPQPVPTPIKPPDTVEIRFRRRSRRQKQQREDAEKTLKMKASANTTTPKKWDDMSLTEKAADLYMGEKGLLFWLNKFAYASIFIMIGAWIFFRFVGPALNLYQLDSPPLSPSSIFKGS